MLTISTPNFLPLSCRLFLSIQLTRDALLYVGQYCQQIHPAWTWTTCDFFLPSKQTVICLVLSSEPAARYSGLSQSQLSVFFYGSRIVKLVVACRPVRPRRCAAQPTIRSPMWPPAHSFRFFMNQSTGRIIKARHSSFAATIFMVKVPFFCGPTNLRLQNVAR